MNVRCLVCMVTALLAVAWVDLDAAGAQQPNLPPEIIAYADTILYNGKILTADDKFTVAEAVAIRDGKFLALGKTDRIVQMAGPHTHRIDLKGKTLIPGIIDLHQHPFTEGMLSYWAEKWLPNEPEWTSVDLALKGIQKAVAKSKPGDSIMIPRIYIGPGADEAGGRTGESICDMWTVEQKFTSILPCAARNSGNLCRTLTREQLDSVSPNNPVVFVGIVNLEPYAINSKAAEAIKPHLPEGKPIFAKEGSSCVAKGTEMNVGGDLFAAQRLIKDYVMFWSEPLESMMQAYRNTTKGVSAAGITLTKEHTALPVITGVHELWDRGELTVRMRMPYPLTPFSAVGNSMSVAPDQAEALFRRIGVMSGIGDDMLRFVGVRPEGIGGNMVAGGVWTIEPKLRTYSNREGGDDRPYGGGGPGEQYRPTSSKDIFEGREALVQAVRFGWDVSTDHTIGDRAVHEVVNAFEEGLQKQIVKRSNQKLHIGHTPLAKLEDIQKMKRLGIKASIGPWHIFLPDMLDAGVIQFGTERYGKMGAPMKSYVNEGAHPALEGDVAGAIFWRMEKAITRKDDKYNRIWNPAEAVTRQEALWMSSLWGAEEIGEQAKLGSIEPGKLADLVVIEKDFMTVPENEIHTIKPLMTMVGGKVVYEVAGGLQ